MSKYEFFRDVYKAKLDAQTMSMYELFRDAHKAQLNIVEALKRYIKERGDIPTKDQLIKFGIDDEDVLKIIDFTEDEKNWCYFIKPDGMNSRTLEDINTENYSDKLYEGFTLTAYQCLYLTTGVETLKFYRLYNLGCEFDEYNAYPEYGEADELELLDLDYIFRAINTF